MDDMMSRISEILDNPEQAERIKQLASSLMNQPAAETSPVPSEPPAAVATNAVPSSSVSGADIATAASSLSGLFGNTNFMHGIPSSDSINRNITLLNAIRPYMRQTRADRISAAVKAMQFISVLAKFK